MGTNGSYEHHLHHQSFNHRNIGNNNTTNTNNAAIAFLPMLCKLSIKDAVKNQTRSSPSPKKDDPSSPRVSCMGQVRRCHNKHKLAISFAPPLITTTKTTSRVKCKRLKRLFSGRNHHLTATTTNKEVFDRRWPKATNVHHHGHDNSAVVVPLNLAEMDPPLPVVKKLPRPCGGEEGMSLWKRRSGGDGLSNLQIQKFQLPNTTQFPPSTNSSRFD